LQAHLLFSEFFWLAITHLGSLLFLLPVVFLFFPLQTPKNWLLFLLFLLGVTLLSQGLKNFLNIHRPLYFLGVENLHVLGPKLYSHSFPSGHSLSAFAVLGAFAFLHPQKKLTLAVGAVFACLIALSRVLVGAHWPSDVLAGSLLGFFSAYFGLKLLQPHFQTQPHQLTPWLDGLRWGLIFILPVLGFIF